MRPRSRRRFQVIVPLLIALWVLSAPLAMASNDCMAMGAMCDGPCGASSCVASVPVTLIVVAPVASAEPLAAMNAPEPPRVVLELPPK